MKRKIKFRVWDKSSKSFYTPKKHGNQMAVSLNGQICEGYISGDTLVSDDCDLVIQQFTGLFDKNGNEIYEGDILTNDLGYKGQIIYDNIWNCLKLKSNPKDGGGLFLNKEILGEIEVIGNIFEHQELLK